MRKCSKAPSRLAHRKWLGWLCLGSVFLACGMWIASSNFGSHGDGLKEQARPSIVRPTARPVSFKSRLSVRSFGDRPGLQSPIPRKSTSSRRIYTAVHNGRKYMASVLSMANEADAYGPTAKARLPPFLAAWADAWPGLHMEQRFSFANHANLRGYGVLVGHYLAIVDSMRYLEAHNETCDFHLVFEDDAMPFKDKTWPPSSKDNHLDARLDDLVSAGGTFMILGGNIYNYNISEAATAAQRPRGGILHAGHADGAYAYVFDCSAMKSAARFLHKHLLQLTGRSHVEKVLWDAYRKGSSRPGNESTGIYVSVPLMVDHKPGLSMTHNRTVHYPFQGEPNFWANNKVKGLSQIKDYPRT